LVVSGRRNRQFGPLREIDPANLQNPNSQKRVLLDEFAARLDNITHQAGRSRRKFRASRCSADPQGSDSKPWANSAQSLDQQCLRVPQGILHRFVNKLLNCAFRVGMLVADRKDLGTTDRAVDVE
jgi:hypothetical protein